MAVEMSESDTTSSGCGKVQAGKATANNTLEQNYQVP